MLLPSVWLSAFSGASDSLNSAARLAARAHVRARFQPQPAVARAVEIHLRADTVELFALVAAHHNALDAAVLHFRADSTLSSSSVMFGSLITLS